MNASDRQSVLVSAAAIVDDLARPRRVLSVCRSYPPELAGFWEFPGGKVEPGESSEQALRRELREELGAEVLLGQEISREGADSGEAAARSRGDWHPAPGIVLRIWYAQLGPDQELGPLPAHSGYRWLGVRNALSVPWLPGNIPIVERVIRDLGGGADFPG